MSNLLTLLVVGHRAPPRLPEGALLDHVNDRLEQIITDCGAGPEVDWGLRLLTGMAPGTDTAAADIAQRHQIPLHLLGPGTPESLNASQQAAERVVWLGAPDIGFHAHEPLSIRDEVVLSFADLVIVIWDGAAPAGYSGGTVRLAFDAARMMKPLVWLDTQGAVRLLDRARLTPAALAQLQVPHPEPALLQHLFCSPVSEAELRPVLQAEIRDYLQHCALAAPVAVPPDQEPEVLQTRQRHCSTAARNLGRRHRRFSWLSYLASALAVFAAVAGAIGLWPGGHGSMWPIMELVLIAGIVAGLSLAKSQDWHGRWINHRFIAEQLRYLGPCLPMLAIPAHFREPVWQAKDGQLSLVSPELLYLQRSLIHQGIPQPENQRPYLPSTWKAQQQQLELIRQELESQRRYHVDKHHRLHRQHEIRHWTSLVIFGLTFLAVILHFILHAAWLLIFTAFFPALAAALHGVSVKLEIGRLAGQSHAAAKELAALLEAFSTVSPEESWYGWLRVRQMTLAAAHVMSRENLQWQELISHQKAELPA